MRKPWPTKWKPLSKADLEAKLVVAKLRMQVAKLKLQVAELKSEIAELDDAG